MKILCFGDSHVKPGVDLSHFVLLGNYIATERPRYIISMGDFVTLDCLSRFDQDKRGKMEGKRYNEELEAGHKALTLMFAEMGLMNEEFRERKQKLYRPSIIFLEGNHEYRARSYLQYNPEWIGKIDIPTDLCITQYEWVPYPSRLNLAGVSFTHALIGDNGKPVSRENIENYALNTYANPVVFGHYHKGIWKNKQRRNADLTSAVGCGMFCKHEEDWILGGSPDYWRGFVVLNVWDDGKFDPEFISIDRLERDYADCG